MILERYGAAAPCVCSPPRLASRPAAPHRRSRSLRRRDLRFRDPSIRLGEKGCKRLNEKVITLPVLRLRTSWLWYKLHNERTKGRIVRSEEVHVSVLVQGLRGPEELPPGPAAGHHV